MNRLYKTYRIHIDTVYMMFILVEGPFKLSSTSAASVDDRKPKRNNLVSVLRL